MEGAIINKVAESALITINLEDYLPKQEVAVFDLKDYLFKGLILKEKDFRLALQETDWSSYQNQTVLITCSADAIIPMWAHMLVASYLQPHATVVFFGTHEAFTNEQLLKNIEAIQPDAFQDKRIVIKGCGTQPIPEAAYVAITTKLLPVAKSIMYGEPCSTVPIYKKK